jgi:predicted LPLAT superfamily acyltransferase
MNFTACAVIPVYNHPGQVETLAASLAELGLPGIFVDDGSDAMTKATLHRLTVRFSQMIMIVLPRNRGKGAAVIAGLECASRRGYTHAIQVDADGQHDLADIPELLRLAEIYPEKLISGLPVYDETVPPIRFYGRYLTHILVWVESLSLRLRDSMCGFRVYPVGPTLKLLERVHVGEHMQFDTEIMVRLYWAGVDSVFMRTYVRYPEDGVSHFRLVSDNARIAWMHVCLLAGLLPRVPTLLRRHTSDWREKHWAELPERGTQLGIHMLDLVYRLLGRRVCHALLVPVVGYFMITNPRARRASRQFLAAVRPYMTDGSNAPVRPGWPGCWLHFWQFAVADLDMLIAWRNPAAIQVSFPGYDELRSVLCKGRGALFIGSHLGNLEIIRALSVEHPDLKINALVYTQHAPKSNRVLETINQAYTTRLIQVHEIEPATAMLLRSKVAAGEVVVIVGDRTPVSVKSPVVEADFLGKPAPFASGPYILAHLLECPVYLIACTADLSGGTYTVHLESFADRIRLPRGGREAALQNLVKRYAQRLEHYAVRFPLQWYNFYDFWSRRQTPTPNTRRNASGQTNVHEKRAHSIP